MRVLVYSALCFFGADLWQVTISPFARIKHWNSQNACFCQF